MLPELEIVKTKSGIFCLFKNNDLIGQSLRQNGSFAEKEANLAIRFARNQPGSLVLDIGANLGAFAIPVAKSLLEMGEEIYLHCFEPQRIVCLQLSTNVFINRLSNVVIHNAAVGHENSDISIPVLDFERSRNPGGFSIDPRIRDNLAQSAAEGITATNTYLANGFESVKQVTLDSISFERPIAFIKLDVEGHELECLKGATKTLRNSRFPPIVFEDWGSKFDWYREKSSQLRAYLTNDLGYVLESIGGRELLARSEEHTSELQSQR